MTDEDPVSPYDEDCVVTICTNGYVEYDYTGVGWRSLWREKLLKVPIAES